MWSVACNAVGPGWTLPAIAPSPKYTSDRGTNTLFYRMYFFCSRSTACPCCPFDESERNEIDRGLGDQPGRSQIPSLSVPRPDYHKLPSYKLRISLVSNNPATGFSFFRRISSASSRQTIYNTRVDIKSEGLSRPDKFTYLRYHLVLGRFCLSEISIISRVNLAQHQQSTTHGCRPGQSPSP